MFAISTKAKIAAGIAAGALTLGAAGAYAANAANTIPTYALPGTSGTLTNNGKTLNVVSLNPNGTLTLPSTPFKNEGQCVSFFAKNKSLALAPTGTTTTVKKNYHGKLLGSTQLKSYCATYNTSSTASASESPDASQSAAPSTDSTDSTDSAGPQAGTHGQGHGHGHGRSANELD